jgi:hypothetical protein
LSGILFCRRWPFISKRCSKIATGRILSAYESFVLNAFEVFTKVCFLNVTRK